MTEEEKKAKENQGLKQGLLGLGCIIAAVAGYVVGRNIMDSLEGRK